MPPEAGSAYGESPRSETTLDHEKSEGEMAELVDWVLLDRGRRIDPEPGQSAGAAASVGVEHDPVLARSSALSDAIGDLPPAAPRGRHPGVPGHRSGRARLGGPFCRQLEPVRSFDPVGLVGDQHPVIIGASPALAALLGFLSLKERPTRRTMFVILVVLLGIGLIFWSDAHAFEATRSQGSPWWGPCFYTRPST